MRRFNLLDREAREAGQLRLVAKSAEGIWLARPASDESPTELLDRIGRVPLPKYIRHGEMVDDDRSRYQTVFAKHNGSAAAPTAGLHFTVELIESLKSAGIEFAKVTLHVGLDTFRPIKSTHLANHAMHSETGRIDSASVERLQQARKAGGRIVAVGTTSVRVLETAAGDGVVRPWEGQTELFIRPPYRFRAVDALMTNFHLPRTTLLILVRTFGGDELIRQAYEEADSPGIPLLQLRRRDADCVMPTDTTAPKPQSSPRLCRGADVPSRRSSLQPPAKPGANTDCR